MPAQILNEPLSGAPGLAALQNDLDTTHSLGSLTVVAHSYGAGSTQVDSGVSNVAQEGCVSRLQALLGIHEDNVLNMALSSSRIAGIQAGVSAAAFGGWAGALQFIVPSNSAQVNATADVVVTDPVEAVGGACVIVHGCNDYTWGHILFGGADNTQKSTNNNAAAKNAYRAVISRMRAGLLFGSYVVGGVITWDSTIAFSAGGNPWGTNVASVNRNSGAAYRYPLIATAAGATVTVTIPTNFTGGVVALCFIGEENGVGHITNAPTNAAGQTISIPAGNQSDFPASGSTFIVKFVSQGEEALCTVTAGPVYTLTTRGLNGTSAAAHSANDVIMWAADTHKVTFSGTAQSSAPTKIGGGTTLQLSGQGTNNTPVACVARFLLTAADAGKTIICTAGGYQTGELNAKCIFDSWWIEAPEAPPIVVTNLHHWRYGGDFQESLSVLADWNTMLTAVTGEFSDGFVRVADVYTPFYNRNGTTGLSGTANAAVTTTNTTLLDTRVTNVPVNALVGSIVTCNGKTMTVTANDNTGSGSSLKITGASWSGGGNPGNGSAWNFDVSTSQTGWVFCANSSTFTPTVGMVFTNGLFGGEQALVTAVAGSYPYYTLTVTRAYGGSSAVTHATGEWIGPLDWMFKDLVHPSIKGHAVYAKAMYDAFNAMPVPSTYQTAAVQGSWAQGSQLPHPGGVFDNYFVYPPVTATTLVAVAAGTQTAHLLYVPKICTLTEIGVSCTNAGLVSPLVRLGIYHPDPSRQRPGRLIQDFGTVAGAISDALNITGCYQILRPGWYFLSAALSGSTTPTVRVISANGWAGPQLGASASLVRATGGTILGCSQAITPAAAFADWAYFSNTMVNAGSIIITVHVRLRMPMYG